MVKLTGPVLSHGAAGKIGKYLTIANSPRGPYMKRHTDPKQPGTPLQKMTQSIVGFLASEWKDIIPADQATWDPLAAATAVDPYHAYMAYNTERVSSIKAPSKTYPAAEVIQPANLNILVATGRVRHVHLAFIAMDHTPTTWCIMLHHRTGGWPWPVEREIVHLQKMETVLTVFWEHADLDPGQQFYISVAGSTDGKSDPDDAGGDSAWST